ncbi:hypothetical protein DAI22_09g172900 [Oryza sativa Japonica Group]|jgi:hypothetical protein|nr:hypothetical protein DAI22_09g172900 [Oryza sativa Japonica Group]
MGSPPCCCESKLQVQQLYWPLPCITIDNALIGIFLDVIPSSWSPPFAMEARLDGCRYASKYELEEATRMMLATALVIDVHSAGSSRWEGSSL